MLRFVCLLALVSVVSMELTLQAKLNDHWQKFKSSHLKSYKPEEEAKRQENFKANVESILSHNLKADLGESDHRLAINEFSDMSIEEFRSTMLGYKPSNLPRNDTMKSSLKANIPASIDWRQYGMVTAIKNQGTCGSCYTFAAAGTVETAWAKASGQLVTLSEQHLLDCAQQEYGYSSNAGCQGGLPNAVYQYIVDNRGISTSACYPYLNKQSGYCGYRASCAGARISGYGTVRRADEWDMADKVANFGAVAVGLDAGPADFMSYKSGVYNNQKCNKQQGNHAVQVVGFGTQNGMDYWLIKNSWGTTWGENGYMKMARNQGNVCGVANDASFPYV